MIDLQQVRQLDATDPLAGVREQFALPAGVVYLDGNSLGPPPRSAAAALSRTLTEWSQDLIHGWFEHGWVDLPATIGARLEPILGAEPSSVMVGDSTTVNLYKAVHAACDLHDGDLLTDSGNFPTDLYVLSEVARRRGRSLRMVEPEAVLGSIDDGVSIVSLTQVDYRTSRLHDLPAITARAHRAGALVVWDLSHSAGVMPIDLAANGVDLAVGCGYKYLNGGPGAPAYLYAAPALQQELANPITGWFGHTDPFSFSPSFAAAPGIERMRVGTPHVLSMVSLDAALATFDGLSFQEIRAKSVRLTSLLIELVDQELGDRVEVVTPRSAAERGSHVSLRHGEAARVVKQVMAAGVICDFRPPDLIRLGLSPLFNTFDEVGRAVSALLPCL